MGAFQTFRYDAQMPEPSSAPSVTPPQPSSASESAPAESAASESGASGPAPGGDAPSLAATRLVLATCFFLSGATGLVYGVLWSRHLPLLFGSTTESVAAVLATFMFGLGLGGPLLGRTADRAASPMRLYGLLEVG